MEKKNQKTTFFCPYCQKVKDTLELNYRTEIGNARPTFDKFGDIRDAYDYRHSNYKYTRYEVPICNDCLIIHQEATFKANLITLCIFVIMVITIIVICKGWVPFLIVPICFGSIVCLIIRWIIKMLLVNKQGIYYYAPNKEFYSNNTFYEAPSTSQQHIELNKDSKEIKDDFFTYIQHLIDIEEKKKKDYKIEEYKLPNGTSLYKYIPIKGLGINKDETVINDFKLNNIGEGTDVSDDDDIDGCFI